MRRDILKLVALEGQKMRQVTKESKGYKQKNHPQHGELLGMMSTSS